MQDGAGPEQGQNLSILSLINWGNIQRVNNEVKQIQNY